ncbi:hypothetical protein [Idiomarina sp. UBA4206]|uniref:hypothetical protein n=1 Tax=Idiomarina sp. UBA4206 TaxID=1946644 RepID=UPI00257A659B|nr:hypothetical protein [Idiomarina sp. UBA4206]
MTMFVFSIKGSVSVESNDGQLLQEAIDTLFESEVRDATLALDNFISYSEKDYSFSGRLQEIKDGVSVSDWVRYSEEDGVNNLTVELINIR